MATAPATRMRSTLNKLHPTADHGAVDGRDQRGVTTLEFTIVAGALLVLIFTAVSYAIFFFAQNIALGAARAGAQAAASQGATLADGQTRAADYLHSVSGTLIDHQVVRATSDGRFITVHVDGDTLTPTGLHLHVHAIAVRPAEVFTTDTGP